jgi:hypothetical protein
MKSVNVDPSPQLVIDSTVRVSLTAAKSRAFCLVDLEQFCSAIRRNGGADLQHVAVSLTDLTARLAAEIDVNLGPREEAQ